MAIARNIFVQGIVQGVGFRPYVYLLALANDLSGWVLNASDGVHIHINGQNHDVQRFIEQLPKQAPVAAKITNIEVTDCDQKTDRLLALQAQNPDSKADFSSTEDLTSMVQCDATNSKFQILESRSATGLSTFISPDLATCDDCLGELFDPADRRYHYPFINCTNCGPRFTIIQSLPYDRPNTSMADFEMCPSCASEYANPADRRFHAQPDACFDCGPQLAVCQGLDGAADGGTVPFAPSLSSHLPSSVFSANPSQTRDRQPSHLTQPDTPHPPSQQQSDAIIQQVAEALEQGRIAAIKGLGGYHLACDATNERAVQTLRERKRRSNKPLAVMMQNPEQVRRCCDVNDLEVATLVSPAHPIVLLRQKARTGLPIAPSVAFDLPELGVMLPCTPLQHLLLAAVGKPLVMTSGNISEEPIVGENSQAHELLAQVADVFLDNDRPITSRYDDSVVRIVNGRLQMVRRARGYAPSPLQLPPGNLPKPAPLALLACGPEQKSSFCLTSNNTAFVSQHLGDLENANTYSNYLATLELYQRLFCIQPTVLVCDQHPEYFSTKWAVQHCRQNNLPLIQVQHHHAHIAAVMAENQLTPTKKVIGVAFDGTGYGEDGSIWGGEILLTSYAGFERFAHLRSMPLPGGEAAIKHPNRLAYALLFSLDLHTHAGAQILRSSLSAADCQLLEQMVSRQINTPQTSSMGRLFDAVSALTGICQEATYDGEPAIALEAAMGVAPELAPEAAPELALEAAMGAALESGTRLASELAPEAAVGAAPESATRPASELVLEAAPGVQAKLPLSPLPPSCHSQNFTDAVDFVPETQNDGGPQTQAVKHKFSVNTTTSPVIIDSKPVILAILEGLQAGEKPAVLAKKFHDAVLQMIVEVSELARRQTQINTVALSGGVFMNSYLSAKLPLLLADASFAVLQHRDLPANDGCIAYGQAAVAAAQLQEQVD